MRKTVDRTLARKNKKAMNKIVTKKSNRRKIFDAADKTRQMQNSINAPTRTEGVKQLKRFFTGKKPIRARK